MFFLLLIVTVLFFILQIFFAGSLLEETWFFLLSARLLLMPFSSFIFSPWGPPLLLLWHLTRSTSLRTNLEDPLRTAVPGPHIFAGSLWSMAIFDYFVVDWFLGFWPVWTGWKLLRIQRLWGGPQSHFQHRPTIHQLPWADPPLRPRLRDDHFFLWILMFRLVVLFLDSSFYLFAKVTSVFLNFKGSSILK